MINGWSVRWRSIQEIKNLYSPIDISYTGKIPPGHLINLDGIGGPLTLH